MNGNDFVINCLPTAMFRVEKPVLFYRDLLFLSFIGQISMKILNIEFNVDKVSVTVNGDLTRVERAG